jgi:hypothetical protein
MDGRRPLESRTCAVCGRGFQWRRSLARDWERVRHCSRGCRARGLRAVDRELEAAIVELLAARARGATICPSEVSRRVDRADLSDLAERTRCAARRLAARGELVWLQGGRRVDPDRARGPVRLGRPR